MGFGNLFAVGGLALGTVLAISLFKLLLGVVYFAFSLLIIKIAASLVGYSALSADMAVIAAAIISAASVIGKEK